MLFNWTPKTVTTSVSNLLTCEDCCLNFYRDQQSMGNRYLEVFQGKRSEYYAAVASVSHSFCSKKSS